MSPGIQGAVACPAEGEWFELGVNGVIRKLKFVAFRRFKGFEEAKSFIETAGYKLVEDDAVEPFRTKFATPPDDYRKVFFGGSPREPEPELVWKAHGKVRIAFADPEGPLGWYTSYGWDTWAFPESCRWAVEVVH